MEKPKIYSAGILPYAKYKNETYFLLGQDRNDDTWSDFGGRSECIDQNSYINTATREFYEETIGSVVDLDVIRQRLSSSPDTYIEIQSNTLNGSKYVMILTQIPYKNYNNIFKRTYEFIKYCKINKKYLEKVDIKWISTANLLNSMKQENESCILRNVFRNTLTKCIDDIEKL